MQKIMLTKNSMPRKIIVVEVEKMIKRKKKKKNNMTMTYLINLVIIKYLQ